jgi:DNA (cytosine-5)-methyltransferase 1
MTEAELTHPYVQALDLFCGAGGLSYGLKQAGISVTAGLDFDHHCQYPFTENIGGSFLGCDLTTASSDDLRKHFTNPRYKLIAGCAPCQPFSTLRNGSDRKQSAKWPLLREFSRVVADIQPDIVTMENVPVLQRQEIFEEFVSNLKRLGYLVNHRIVDASRYGVPQRRKRLVLLASLLGPIRIISADELGLQGKTVRQAISHLPPIAAGETSLSDPLHRARSLTPLNMIRMKHSKPGGTWQDWPEQLRLECHKKEGGSSFKSVYGRMEWDKPSGTMTTQSYNFGTGRYGHPEQHRSISLREMAILQSFPDDYKFAPPGSEPEFTSIGRLIGNAVPVKLGFVIGKSILHHISEHEDRLSAKQA